MFSTEKETFFTGLNKESMEIKPSGLSSDLFFGAPDYISEEQLKELNIKVDKIEK